MAHSSHEMDLFARMASTYSTLFSTPMGLIGSGKVGQLRDFTIRLGFVFKASELGST